MSINQNELIAYLDDHLCSQQIKDFCPNGLQVEGKPVINKIITGVTASQALIDAAIENNADAILVHHGYFWKGEPAEIKGMKKQRIKRLLQHDINLIAYHLPIDVHPTLGNNAQLARKLNITSVEPVEGATPIGVVMRGEFVEPVLGEQLVKKVEQSLLRKPLSSMVRNEPIKTVAWCTGGGQSYIDLAASLDIDLFITGEASEQTIHSSREQGIDFIAAGHHATERYGVQALGNHLAEKFGLEVQFIDIDNPV